MRTDQSTYINIKEWNKNQEESKVNKKKAVSAVAAGMAITGAVVLNRKMKHEEYQEGETALITGASGGIGYALAEEFASHKFNLVLAARNEEKLNCIRKDFETRYGVEVTVVPVDLSVPGNAQKLYYAVKEKGIEVDQLVNNAGAGKAGRVVDTDPDVMEGLINLNVTSVTMLCRLFGADMVARGHGHIMNVSSLGGFIPDPYFNVYGPTKAYELFLTEAMSGELEKSGVTVSALCPGPTKTNWANNAGKADSSTALTPETVAKYGYEGMQEGRLVIYPGRRFKAEKILLGLLPVNEQTAFIAKWQKKLIEEA